MFYRRELQYSSNASSAATTYVHVAWDMLVEVCRFTYKQIVKYKRASGVATRGGSLARGIIDAPTRTNCEVQKSIIRSNESLVKKVIDALRYFFVTQTNFEI